MLSALISPFVNIDYSRIKIREKSIGYTLEFPKLPIGWIQGYSVFDMTPVWKKAGLSAVGVTKFTIGNIQNGISTRFDPLSPYYQAWFGGYVVKFDNPYKWTIVDHFKLGEEDQNEWLRLYGDTNPLASVESKNVQLLSKVKIQNFKATIYRGGGWSHTDVGKGKRPILYPLYMEGFAQMIMKSNPRLRLSGNNFSPHWLPSYPLDSFQKIWIDGYVMIVDLTESVKAVVFGNGAIYTDRNSIMYDTFKTLKNEIVKLIKSVEFMQLP